MDEFKQARENMVDCQVRTNDVTDHAVLTALLSVPRERFVPPALRPFSYIDEDLSLDEIGESGRYLMEPGPFAKLLQLAEIGADDIVLDVGCGSGYSTAVLAKLCNSVVAIEKCGDLSEYASKALADLEIFNAVVICDPLTDGYTQEAPYDVVFIGGAIQTIPDEIFDQVREGGKVVAVEGQGNAATAKVFRKHNGTMTSHTAFNCSVKPLPGFEAAPQFVF